MGASSLPRAPVVSLNSASGVHASRAARSAYAAVLHPANSKINPRFSPAVRRVGEQYGVRDNFPAGLAEPAPVKSVAWAGGRWNWPQELKPFFSDLLLSIVIIGYMAAMVDMDVYLVTDDAKDLFHQFSWPGWDQRPWPRSVWSGLSRSWNVLIPTRAALPNRPPSGSANSYGAGGAGPAQADLSGYLIT